MNQQKNCELALLDARHRLRRTGKIAVSYPLLAENTLSPGSRRLRVSGTAPNDCGATRLIAVKPFGSEFSRANLRQNGAFFGPDGKLWGFIAAKLRRIAASTGLAFPGS